MEIINRPINEVRPYENNPRNNKAAVEKVANSIKEFGFKVPIVVDTDGVILTGHTRLKAAISLGMKEVPVIVAADLNEAQKKAFRLADNKTGEIATWDMELLDQELQDLYGILDMNDFGFPVQIENIDSDEEGTHKISPDLDEISDYVVLKFESALEWEKAIAVLGLEIKTTNDKNPRIRRHGMGRVIDGAAVIKRLGGQ